MATRHSQEHVTSTTGLMGTKRDFAHEFPHGGHVPVSPGATAITGQLRGGHQDTLLPSHSSLPSGHLCLYKRVFQMARCNTLWSNPRGEPRRILFHHSAGERPCSCHIYRARVYYVAPAKRPQKLGHACPVLPPQTVTATV